MTRHVETKAIDFTSTTLSTADLSFEVIDGPHRGLTLRLEQEFIRIGRGAWCDLVLSEDAGVSKLHCECWFEEKGLRIRDMNSRNGIRVNGVRVSDAFLEAGSKLHVGGSLLLLKSHRQTREIAIQYKDETGTLVGKSHQMRKIFSMISKIGQRNVSAVLTGETGTGKTSIAQAIHNQNDPKAPFVIVNCGALPAGLIEGALFGHVKGAFTGADKEHTGFFQQADGGTLFLDEIAEMPLDLQPKLLDVLERRMVRKLGSEKEHKVDFRLISATHRDLPKEIQEGRFREDLYFRLAVVELEIPPLRQRKEDMALLVEALLHELPTQDTFFITRQAIDALETQLWPGNIRELRNVLERSITFLEGNQIDVEDLALPAKTGTSTSLPVHIPRSVLNTHHGPISDLYAALPTPPLEAHPTQLSLKDILVDIERALLTQALEESGLNAPTAAKLLDISESWLYSRIKRFGLTSQRKR